MKTALLNDSFNLNYFDGLLEDFIEDNSNSLGGKEMTIAILPPIEPKKYLNPIRPYRTITTTGLNEFVSITNFLEELELFCINKNADSIEGFDCVFIIPEEEFYELYPENDPNYEQKIEALRAMFKK
ncbi:hypothetical protein [Vibrio sp. STUT-A11]|uniref:hypothetical protein n=1 Tax=Vibrio sp. STUT-A11 TaxID=2976236 RepID=UPI0022323A5C|nr:hypothetical protein [Vibrio sp. STUT-A11]BDR15670.1 hypothetical protein VspSTUT11_36460 [Vibrio sp. STUT-A11]